MRHKPNNTGCFNLSCLSSLFLSRPFSSTWSEFWWDGGPTHPFSTLIQLSTLVSVEKQVPDLGCVNTLTFLGAGFLGWFSVLGLAVDPGGKSEFFCSWRKVYLSSVDPPEKEHHHSVHGHSRETCWLSRPCDPPDVLIWRLAVTLLLVFVEGTKEFLTLYPCLWRAILPTTWGFPSLTGTPLAWDVNKLMGMLKKLL